MKTIFLSVCFLFVWRTNIAQGVAKPQVANDSTGAQALVERAYSLANANKLIEAVGLISDAEHIFDSLTAVLPNYSLQEKRIYAKILLADYYRMMGRLEEARDKFNESFHLAETLLGMRHVYVGRCYMGLGTLFAMRGNLVDAGDQYQKALAIYLQKPVENIKMLGNIYNNIGIISSDQGDQQSAIYYFQKSLQIKEQLGGKENRNTFSTYFNIADCYLEIGGYEEAERYLNTAKRVFEATASADYPTSCDCDMAFGALYLAKKEPEKSEKHYRSAVDCYVSPPRADSVGFAEAYMGIGNALVAQRKIALAREHLQMSLNTHKRILGNKHQLVSEVYEGLAQASLAEGRETEALREIQMAMVAFLPRFNDYDPLVNPPVDEMLGMDNRIFDFLSIKADIAARIYEKDPNRSDMLKLAFSTCQRLFELVEKTRAGFGADESKQMLTNQAFSGYEQAIRVAIKLSEKAEGNNYKNDAFLISERSKAVLLEEALRLSGARQLQGVPEEIRLQERNLNSEISYYQQLMYEEEQKGENADKAQLGQWAAIRFRLFEQRKSLTEAVKREYPDYFNLKYQVNPVSVEATRQIIPDDSTALLEYFVGDSSIFIFLVKKDDYRVIEVKKDFPMEEWVQRLRRGISTNPDEPNQQLRNAALQDYTQPARALYDKLLAPVAALLPRRLVVVPDGVLGYIPFGALLAGPAPASDRYQAYPYFGSKHHISYSYSATLLREMTQRKHRRQPAEGFLAYAPYFDGDTTLLASRYIDPANPANRLPALKHAAEEVEELHKLMGGKAVIGRSARKDSLLEEAGRYRILHLSTHGKANDKVGDYSFLAFSEVKDSIENEWLYVRDIYNLSLNADMVVLSACETGIGELKRGEGIISLARAFAYAGAKSIVTTLWSVDDARTKDFMVFFYRNLKEGMSKDKALAKARSDYFRKHKGTNAHPYFWAGFVGIGDMTAIRN